MSQEKEWNNLPTWLPPLIKKAGKPVEKIAYLAKINRVSIYLYMNGSKKPNRDTMIRLCKVLGVPPEEGFRQYSPAKIGRPKDSGTGIREVRVRTRR